MNNAVVIENLSVSYGKTPVLWDINCIIPKGKVVGIIGPNGAGKSTLLRAILGMLRPLHGEVRFFGETLKEAHDRIAYVPQRTSVDWDFPATVLDVVAMGCYGRLGLFKWVGKKERKAAMEALEKVGMEAFAHRQISELSGGQQQRVFLARAFMQNADLYCMDEPFGGVDMATEKALITILHQLQKEGKTLLIVHHDLNTVPQYFDWVMLLNTCLIGCGPLSEQFTEEKITRTYGRSAHLLGEAKKLTAHKTSGI